MSKDTTAAAKTSTLLLKSFAYYLFVILVMTVAVPLTLLWVANGRLAFEIGWFRFLGVIPIFVGVTFTLGLPVYFAIFGRGTPAPLIRLENL